MKTIIVYPTKKLAEAGQIVPLGMGVDIQPADTEPIAVPIHHPGIQKNIDHYVKTGKLSLKKPTEKLLTKSDLIELAKGLGIEWDEKEMKMKNDDMQAIIDAHIAEKAEEDNDDLVSKDDEAGK